MKKLALLLAFAIVFIYGCEKSDLNSTSENKNVENSNAITYVFNLEDESASWELTDLRDVSGISSYGELKQSNSAHTHGNIPNLIVFSGTHNNGGTHGSATATINGPSGTTYLTMETECVMVDGSEAVYGGLMTQVVNPFGGFQEGNIAYFKVFDNGQGNNAPLDNYHGLVRVSNVSRYGDWTPDNAAIWPPTFYGYNMIIDVPEPGSVKVNN